MPKWWPWLPFSRARIISDRYIWMLSHLQFHFQFIFGYESKTVFSCSYIAKESVAIQTGCGKDMNQIKGTSWPKPIKKESNNFCPDPGNENIWEIFVHFKCQIHNERLPGWNCCFLAFFKIGSKVSAWQVSSLSDQPFRIFHRQIQKIHPIFDCFDKEKHLAKKIG